jgi:predicted ATP-grasp superfamily ATP-dependent carboligase
VSLNLNLFVANIENSDWLYYTLTMSTNQRTIVYITRDIERALGMEPSQNYRIITNRTAYAENVQLQFPGFITLIDSPTMLDTSDLMEHEVTLETLAHLDADVVVFKSNSRIETIALTYKWKLINPPAALAEKVENKISQVEWLGTIGEEWLPPHQVQPAKEIIWNKEPLIVQWAHGHTGDSTVLINSAEELKVLQEKFPERLARVTIFINGPSFTANVVVTQREILVGNISYQITGIPPFTRSPFTTIGNDWSIPPSLLTEEELEQISSLAKTLGEKLRADGWKGLFGIDMIRDNERNRLFLLEINARQPASTTYESQLQTQYRSLGISGQTTLEAHLGALQNNSSDLALVVINDGAQVIQRVTDVIATVPTPAPSALAAAGYTVIIYPNTEPNTDLIRVQSSRGLMESHGKFNSRGQEISDIIRK